jgi:hypothetical protein
MASLLSGMDVHRCNRFKLSPQSLGMLHRHLRCRPLGLYERFRYTFLYSGLQRRSEWIHTGHLQRPDLLIAIPAWLASFVVIIGCVWGYWRLRDKSWNDAGKLVLTFLLTTGFFALDMYAFQPRYLGIFPPLLRPHMP